MKNMSLHDMAVRLAEGGIVDFGGYAIKAKDVGQEIDLCCLCSMDSVCTMDLADLCAEVDSYTRSKHIIMFANEQK